MSINEFITAVTRYLARALARKFTGKIVITINAHQGGIGNVNVSMNHDLTKDSD